MAQRILLLSDSHEYKTFLERSLGDESFDIDSNIKSIDELATLAAKTRSDIILVVMDQSNTETMETIRQLMQENPVPVVMFVNEGDENSAAAATHAGVSAFVIDGLRDNRVKPILTAAVARFKETHKLRQELDIAQASLKERKLVERAKGLLMKQRDCSEDEAYTALRTLAMKQNKRLGEIAEGVINTVSLMT